MSGICAEGLWRTFVGPPPVSALAGASVRVEAGSLTAVLGPSGCGKTTLLRVLAGFERPDAGLVEVDGQSGPRRLDGPGVHVPSEQRGIGFVPQEGALFPHLDVAGNVAFGLRGTDRSTRRARVGELLELVGLPGYGPRRPDELSGGQQQRVALARALAPGPALVLLDEPFSALDTALRAAVRDEVVGLLRDLGATTMLVTHDQTEALLVADRLAVMRQGGIVQSATPREVYLRPVDAWVGGFLGDAVVVPGRLQPGERPLVTSCLGTHRLSPGDVHHPGPDVSVFLRPEQIVIADRGDGGFGDGVAAIVRSTRFYGPETVVELSIGGELVRARCRSTDVPAPDTEVSITVSEPVLVFPPA